MEEDQELKFVCKLCDRRYPCGKSLGGHMRSHVMANSAESEEKVELHLKSLSSLNGGKCLKGDQRLELGGQSAYGLRENPKKTWRAVDAHFPLPQEKVCKQCGKAFQSLKALCGHMACHSEKDRGLKDDHSWTSENHKLVMDSHSDTEVEDRKLRSRSKIKRYNKLVVKPSLSLANGSSSVSEVDEQEQQEEVAKCLMMLSRDSLNWHGVNSVVESSDNNSVVLETKSSSIDMRIGRREGIKNVSNRGEKTQMKNKEVANFKSSEALDAEIAEVDDSDSEYFLGENTIVESDLSVDGIHRSGVRYDFQKYQESVGTRYDESRTDQKEKGVTRPKNLVVLKNHMGKEVQHNDGRLTLHSGKYESRKRYKDSSDNSDFLNECSMRMASGSSEDAKRRKYECLNCKKTFTSYQALGGHRPCHKRSNTSYEPRYETGENSLDGDYAHEQTAAMKYATSTSSRKPVAEDYSRTSDKKLKPKKSKGHECPFCHRMFKSGQALGGHKRSHFLGGAEGTINHASVIKQDLPDMLDLNLPAPVEDEYDEHAHFMSW